MTTLPISHLVERARQGDADAWEALYLRHAGPLRTHLRSKGWGYEDAEDLASMALAKAWANLDRYDPARSAFNTWLYHVADREAVSLWRHRGRAKRGDGHHVPVEAAWNEPARSPDPEVWVERRETLAEVARAMRAQPPAVWKVFATVVAWGGLEKGDPEAIAEATGLAPRTAKDGIYLMRLAARAAA